MRAKAFVILWGVAAIAATSIAWQGVSIVDSQVISPAPAISTDRSSSLTIPVEPASTPTPSSIRNAGEAPAATPGSTAELEVDLDLTALDRATAGVTDDDTDDTPPGDPAEPLDEVVAATPNPTATARPRRPAPEITPPPTLGRTEQPTTAASPTPTAPPVATTDAPTPGASATATPKPTATAESTPSVSPTPAPAQVLTFDLVGGTASVSFSSSEVHVLWATPEPGFTARIGSSGPGQRVDFTGGDGESRLDVWWNGGPQWSIDEDHD